MNLEQDLQQLGVTLLGPVVGLEDANILGPCVLGHPVDGDAPPLVLGPNVTIRAYAVLYAGSTLESHVHVAHGAVVREHNHIGAHASIGASVQLWPGNVIGARTRLQAGCFLESTKLGNDVFCGPNVVFTDDPHPPCPSYLDCVGGATVHDRVSIGANTTVLPGVTIGAEALVGAASTVTRDVETGTVVAGSPARVVGRRDELACRAGIYARAYAWQEQETLDLRKS